MYYVFIHKGVQGILTKMNTLHKNAIFSQKKSLWLSVVPTWPCLFFNVLNLSIHYINYFN